MNKLIEWYKIVFRFWMRFPEKIRYLLVGGYNTVVSYALYAALLWYGREPQLALFLSFLISSVNSYLTQKYYVFNTPKVQSWEYLRCLMSWGISYVINAFLLKGLLMTGMNPYLAQFIALAIVTINSYLMLKYLAFRNHKIQGE